MNNISITHNYAYINIMLFCLFHLVFHKLSVKILSGYCIGTFSIMDKSATFKVQARIYFKPPSSHPISSTTTKFPKISTTQITRN